MWYVYWKKLLIEKNVFKTYLGSSSSKSFRGSDFEHCGVSSDSGLTSFKSLFISNTVLVVLLMFSLSSGIQALLLFILSHVFTSRLLSLCIQKQNYVKDGQGLKFVSRIARSNLYSCLLWVVWQWKQKSQDKHNTNHQATHILWVR